MNFYINKYFVFIYHIDMNTNNVKVCNKCDLVKGLSEFSGNRATCKSCRADAERESYKNKKPATQTVATSSTSQLSEPQNPYVNTLLNKILNMQQHIYNEPLNLDILKTKALEILSIVEQMETGRSFMIFRIKTSSYLQDYVTKIVRNKGSIKDALETLRSCTPIHGQEISRMMLNKMQYFESTYGINPKELCQIIFMELDDLIKILGGLEAAYIEVIDDYNETVSYEFSERRINRRLFSIFYNPVESEIVLENLLKCDKSVLFNKIAQLKINTPPGLSGFVLNGYYEKFYDILMN
jgi:hypothetical protein